MGCSSSPSERVCFLRFDTLGPDFFVHVLVTICRNKFTDVAAPLTRRSDDFPSGSGSQESD